MLAVILTSTALLAIAQAPMMKPMTVAPIASQKPVGPGGGCDTNSGPSRGTTVHGGRTPQSATSGLAGRGRLAIGPKQDDPLTPEADGGARPGNGVLAIGPKQDDPLTSDANDGARPGNGVLSIGPKQDDPRTPAGLASRPGDDEDPHAAHGGNGALAIGPKQDDPRAPAGLVARPGDDEDPHARGLENCPLP